MLNYKKKYGKKSRVTVVKPKKSIKKKGLFSSLKSRLNKGDNISSYSLKSKKSKNVHQEAEQSIKSFSSQSKFSPSKIEAQQKYLAQLQEQYRRNPESFQKRDEKWSPYGMLNRNMELDKQDPNWVMNIKPFKADDQRKIYEEKRDVEEKSDNFKGIDPQFMDYVNKFNDKDGSEVKQVNDKKEKKEEKKEKEEHKKTDEVSQIDFDNISNFQPQIIDLRK